MPFTFSHPAIVLPFTFLPRQWFSLTGLIIGSLTPDFEYFLRMKVQSTYSHTIGGLLWFDLPLGLLLVFIFHNLVRESLFDNLPAVLRSRFITYKKFNWTNYFQAKWLIVLISILIGAASHLFWDSFTHHHSYFVENIPILTSTIEVFGREVPILKILQHSSTLLGGFVIAIAIFRLPKTKVTQKKPCLKYWGIIVSLTVIIIAFRFLSGLDYQLIGHVIATSISAGLIALTLTSWGYRNKNCSSIC